jgi:uncharacterized membrane protein (UPF0127 family)
MADDLWERRLDGLQTEAHGGFTVHVARSYRERARGLARMTPLPARHALHILKCRSVHTIGMRFDLDLVWLDKHGAVVRVDRDVPPNRLRTCVAARTVLETPAGGGEALAAALGPAT